MEGADPVSRGRVKAGMARSAHRLKNASNRPIKAWNFSIIVPQILSLSHKPRRCLSIVTNGKDKGKVCFRAKKRINNIPDFSSLSRQSAAFPVA
jgi:hypothetical protein